MSNKSQQKSNKTYINKSKLWGELQNKDEDNKSNTVPEIDQESVSFYIVVFKYNKNKGN